MHSLLSVLILYPLFEVKGSEKVNLVCLAFFFNPMGQDVSKTGILIN